jgi:hypothetical protein
MPKPTPKELCLDAVGGAALSILDTTDTPGLGSLCPTVILFLNAGGVGGGGLRANNNERGSQDSESRCESTMLHKSTSSKSRADSAKDAPGN